MDSSELLSNINRTDSVNTKLVEHAIEREKSKTENIWRSLCLDCDKRAVQYFSQLFFIGCIMLFCIFKLEFDRSAESQEAYTALLTLLIGIVIPNPKLAS